MKVKFIFFLCICIFFLSCSKNNNSKDNLKEDTSIENTLDNEIDNSDITEDKEFSFLEGDWKVVLEGNNSWMMPKLNIYSVSFNTEKNTYSVGFHGHGGPFAYGNFRIEDKHILLEYPNYIYTSESKYYKSKDNESYLKIIFPEEKTQIFNYNPEENFYSVGSLESDNCVLTSSIPSSTGKNYFIENNTVEVTKLEPKEMYSSDTLKFRSGPGTSYSVENFKYGFSDLFYFSEDLDELYEYNNLDNENLLLKGYSFSVTAKTVKEETYDGVTASWYKINIWGLGEESLRQTFWIFGGYLKECEPDVSYRNMYIEDALRVGYIRKK